MNMNMIYIYIGCYPKPAPSETLIGSIMPVSAAAQAVSNSCGPGPKLNGGPCPPKRGGGFQNKAYDVIEFFFGEDKDSDSDS